MSVQPGVKQFIFPSRWVLHPWLKNLPKAGDFEIENRVLSGMNKNKKVNNERVQIKIYFKEAPAKSNCIPLMSHNIF